MYIMSQDLAKFMVEESVRSNCSYCVGFEGHDISTMAFYHPKPLSLLVIGRHQQFWTDNMMEAANQSLGTAGGADGRPTFMTNRDDAKGQPEAPAERRVEQRSAVAGTRAGGPRVLLGIFSTTSLKTSYLLRKRVRSLFELRNDTRVCLLSDFRNLSIDARRNHSCELVYTFVMGIADGGSELPTEIVGNDNRPLLANITHPDAAGDFLFLNIRENMDFGKSQTWLNYASQVAEEYEIEYVAKCDEDSVLHLPRYFQFSSDHLPPAPYNTGILSGRIVNKANWGRWNYRQYRDNDENPEFVGFLDERKNKANRPQQESFFDENFDKVHIYIAGKITQFKTGMRSSFARSNALVVLLVNSKVKCTS
jgi:hypothetical protein